MSTVTVAAPAPVVHHKLRDSTALLRAYAAKRDPRDLEELTHRFRPLARKLALRYARAGEPIDDLEQVANLGLIKALHRYDPDRGFAFTSFAVPTILGELKRSFRDTAWAAHVPRAVQERVAEMRKAVEAFSSQHGRSPTARELTAELGCSEEDVVEAMAAGSSLSPVSLDMPARGEDDDLSPLGERFGDDDSGYELVDDRMSIASAMPLLPAQQREVLRLRFEEDLKQSDIALRIGVSQMQVSRLLRTALATLDRVVNHRSALPARG